MPTETKRNAAEPIALAGPAHPPVALDKFREDAGISPVTAWRWRVLGYFKTVNIAGRHYVPHESIVEFNDRAARGEFSRKLIQPDRNAKTKASAKPARRNRKPARLAA